MTFTLLKPSEESYQSSSNGVIPHTGLSLQMSVNRRKLNRAWETLRALPVPAIVSDRLVDLHDDLAYYDTIIAEEMREYVRGRTIDPARVRIDGELEETLRAFKPQNAAEVECRRELLRYKRRIDDVVRELMQATIPEQTG